MSKEDNFDFDLEEVPLFVVFKHEGIIGCRIIQEARDFELFGFLKLFLERYEDNLKDLLEDVGDEREYD